MNNTVEQVTPITVNVKGVVKGFQMPGETLEQAQARIVLDVEQHGNAAAKARIHLSLDTPKAYAKDVCVVCHVAAVVPELGFDTCKTCSEILHTRS